MYIEVDFKHHPAQYIVLTQIGVEEIEMDHT